MAEETVKPNTQTPVAPAEHAGQDRGGFRGRLGQGGGRPGGRPGGRRDTRPARVKPEFEQKIIQIRRVTRVIAGGKRFNFSVAMVIGNKGGQVGVGIGKGADTALAIEKAFRNAKKNMVKLKLTDSKSIPHEVKAKFSSGQVYMQPSPGRGIVAGSAVRDVLALAGIVDVNAKILSTSKNKLNIARAAMLALNDFVSK